MMLKKIMVNTIAILVLSVFGVTLTVFAQSDDLVGVKIQPSLIEERADPGARLPLTLKVTNLSNDSRTYYLVKRNITKVLPNGTPVFSDENVKETEYELSSWISIPSTPIVLNPEETKDIPFSIQVPKSASPGGHFGGIFLSGLPTSGPQGIGSGVAYEIGSIINIRITGDVTEDADLRGFATDKIMYGSANVVFTTKVENLGNVLVRPRGPLDITDMWGKKVATLTVNDEAAGVFPKTDREFELKWNGEGFHFGRYEAVVSLVYGEDGRKTITSVNSFWILPVKTILPIVIGTIAVILILFVSIRLHIRKKLQEIYRTTQNSASFQGTRNGAGVLPQKPSSSRLMLISIAMLLITLIFLALLFILFA